MPNASWASYCLSIILIIIVLRNPIITITKDDKWHACSSMLTKYLKKANSVKSYIVTVAYINPATAMDCR
jgi:hypothetical protein